MYTTDIITLPRFCFGRGVYARFPALCRPLGDTFAVIGGVTAMEKGLPALTAALEGSGMTMLAALPFGGACTQQAMNHLAAAIAPFSPAFLVGRRQGDRHRQGRSQPAEAAAGQPADAGVQLRTHHGAVRRLPRGRPV